MAGGFFAQVIWCMECGARAERIYEGIEDDHYLCEAGHRFGVDWSRGAPTEPQWPPSADDLALIRQLLSDRAKD